MEEPVQQAWALVRRLVTEGEVPERMGSLSRATGLSPGLMKALVHLRRRDHLSMRDVARDLGCDPSYLTGMIDELAERGLAERRPHPEDRRVKMVVLTEDGVFEAERINAALGVPPTSFESLTRAEAAQLVALLAKVVGSEA